MENKVIFSRVASKEKMFIIGVSDASYKQKRFVCCGRNDYDWEC